MKLPSFQFYPGDWMKDPALRLVSVSARGLWMDMLCLMFESPQRGFLEHQNGKPITSDQLARVVGAQPKEAKTLLSELADAGVYSVDDRGVIFSRRMVREEQGRARVSEERSRAGKKGMANRWHGEKQTDNKPDNKTPNSEITKHNSSSSSSLSSSSSTSSSELSLSNGSLKPEPGEQKREGGKSRFSEAERRAYADAKGMGDGWLNLSPDGRYDEGIQRYFDSQSKAAGGPAKAESPAPGETQTFDLVAAAEGLHALVEAWERTPDEVLASPTYDALSVEDRRRIRERYRDIYEPREALTHAS